MRWEPKRQTDPQPYAVPGFLAAVLRGVQNRCPCCGEGKVFRGYLKVVPECSHCGAPLGELRADDAPPYFTILVTGHVLVPLLLWVETTYEPPIWLHMAIWLPVFTLACLLLLRPIKGAVVGWMCALGFTGQEHGVATLPSMRSDG